MRQLALQRSADDRRRYEIAGVGWLRGAGRLTQRAAAGRVVGATEWEFEPRGWTGGRAEALAAGTGALIGDYRRASAFSHRGEVGWGPTQLRIASDGRWGHLYALSVGEVPVLRLRVHALGGRRVTLDVDAAWEREPGLVLFACWLGQLFAGQDTAGAA